MKVLPALCSRRVFKKENKKKKKEFLTQPPPEVRLITGTASKSSIGNVVKCSSLSLFKQRKCFKHDFLLKFLYINAQCLSCCISNFLWYLPLFSSHCFSHLAFKQGWPWRSQNLTEFWLIPSDTNCTQEVLFNIYFNIFIRFFFPPLWSLEQKD